jgi:hypothetical protein
MFHARHSMTYIHYIPLVTYFWYHYALLYCVTNCFVFLVLAITVNSLMDKDYDS